MKIYLAQLNYNVGDFGFNTRKIVNEIKKAEKSGADLAVFSEMCICGYPAADYLFSEQFLNDTQKSIGIIREFTAKTAVIIGAPERVISKGQKKLYNAAWFIYKKQIQTIIRKKWLSDSGGLSEHRYFDSGKGAEIINFKGKKILLSIESLKNNAGTLSMMKREHANLFINIAAEKFSYLTPGAGTGLLRKTAGETGIPAIRCRATGAQAGHILSGGSAVADKNGELRLTFNLFREQTGVIKIKNNGTCTSDSKATKTKDFLSHVATDELQPGDGISVIRKALVSAIRDYFRKAGLKQAIVGNSGGIDSAVTIALASEALGHKNVFTLLMPSQYSSSGSISDGEQLCKNLGIGYHIIPIKELFESFLKTLDPLFGNKPADITEENIQARIRGNLLMAAANKFGYVLLNTSNKSELAVGYGTLYGDLAGGLSVLGDCFKLQIYELAKNINRKKEIIPVNILEKAPSAELSPGQKDSQSLPPYDILDRILFQYIELHKDADELIKMGFDSGTVKRIMSMVNKNEFKRHQFCPIISITDTTYGTGRQMPVISSYQG